MIQRVLLCLVIGAACGFSLKASAQRKMSNCGTVESMELKQRKKLESINSSLADIESRVLRVINRGEHRKNFSANRVLVSLETTPQSAEEKLQLIVSSGNRKLDNKAFSAIRKASPFPVISLNQEYSGLLFNFGKSLEVSLVPKLKVGHFSCSRSDWYNYLRNVIKYKCPDYRERVSKPVTCELKFNENGTISNLRILSSSGSQVIDQSCLSVLQETAPVSMHNQLKIPPLVISFTGVDVVVNSAAMETKTSIHKTSGPFAKTD